jgi:transposase
LLGPQWRGKIQCDGYSAYPAFARNKEGVELFGCWAHARRGVFEAQPDAPKIAAWLLHQMSLIYGWEAQLRQAGAGPKARQAFRASHHQMVVERLHRVLLRLRPRYLPESNMGKAFTYFINQWPTLLRILDHGEVELTNNLVENVIRPTAVGKRTTYSSAQRRPVNATRLSTPSSPTVGCTRSIPTPTSKTSRPASRQPRISSWRS